MTESLAFYKSVFRGAVFEEWLEGVRGRGYGSGSDLIIMLGTPREGRPGLGDNVYAADCLLRAAEREGIIKRVSHDPSVELQFFGCGGLSVRKGKPTQWSRPVEFGYVVGV